MAHLHTPLSTDTFCEYSLPFYKTYFFTLFNHFSSSPFPPPVPPVPSLPFPSPQVRSIGRTVALSLTGPAFTQMVKDKPWVETAMTALIHQRTGNTLKVGLLTSTAGGGR